MESELVTEVADRDEKSDLCIVNYWAEKGKRFIDRSYERITGVGDVSYDLEISPSYLRTVFRDSFGLSLKDYLTRVRIGHAKELLRIHGTTVYEVARKVGYRQTITFEKAFKKVVGVPPSKYRGGGRMIGDFCRRKLQAILTARC